MMPESPAPQPPPGEATRPIKRLGDPPELEWVPGRLSLGGLMFKIEAGIPIPAARSKGIPARKNSRHFLYPFEHMERGDSFLMPLDGESVETVHNRANNAKCRNQSATGRRYTCRVVEAGVRVWRTK